MTNDVIEPVETQLSKSSFLKEKIRNAVPATILDNNPKFYEFLKAYYDWLDQPNNIGDKFKSLSNSRNIDLSDYKNSIQFEIGKKIPVIGNINTETLLKILHLFYDAKGSKESIEAYFRLFLNEDARITYPKDNMLITDDGVWDDDADVYVTNKGFLDDAYIVLQDDLYYQIYSYVIKSGLSVSEWGAVFNEIAHPAGWIFFGEIELVGFAQFRINGLSPLFVPGLQEFELPALQQFGIGVSDEDGIQQEIVLHMYPMAAFTYDTLDLAHNILGSEGMTIHDLQNFTIAQLTTNATATTIRRGATIDIS